MKTKIKGHEKCKENELKKENNGIKQKRDGMRSRVKEIKKRNLTENMRYKNRYST